MTDYRTFDAYGREVTPADVQARLGGSLQHVLALKGSRGQASPTPVADALQRVNQVQADNTNIAAWVQKDRELAALRQLAAAVHSHGIGAELGQLRATARLAQWQAEAERAVTAAGEGQDVAGLLELLEALTAAVSDAQAPLPDELRVNGVTYVRAPF